MKVIAHHDRRTPVAVIAFAALPTVGLFGGGAYAAIVVAMAAILLIVNRVDKRLLEVDETLTLVAVLFVLWLWLGWTWSIAPARTASGALQMTALFIAGIVVLGLSQSLASSSTPILRTTLAAAVIGPILLGADLLSGHPILSMVMGPQRADVVYYEKLARGLAQLSVLIWPLLAFGWQSGRKSWALAAGGVLALLLGWQIQNNVAVTISFAFGLLVSAVALAAPRLAAGVLAVLVSAAAIATPFVIQGVGRSLMEFADRIKPSARHRLEIWDYLTARALERPISGWGWQTAQLLPVTDEEKAHYKYFWANGIPHPHDFWVQLWVETGIPGVLLGFAFMLIVLRRISRLPQDTRPFGLAAFATAFMLSLPSFNLSTDSWWCALMATAMLFALLPSARQRLAQ